VRRKKDDCKQLIRLFISCRFNGGILALCVLSHSGPQTCHLRTARGKLDKLILTSSPRRRRGSRKYTLFFASHAIVATTLQPCVYILTKQQNGTLYVGVTSNIVQRIWQHREKLIDGFCKQHGLDKLVWFEQHATIEAAIAREKAVKESKRQWKLSMIERSNPTWKDLYHDLL
jgi:putative endonuclease